MNIFLHILYSNIIPLFLLAMVGVLLQKRFRFDVKVFSKLHMVVFAPALVFLKIYQLDLNSAIVLDIIVFFFLLIGSLFVLTALYIKLRGCVQEQDSVMYSSVMFFNSGNFGLPLILLVFAGDHLAVSVQLIIMILQTIVPYTLGAILMNTNNLNKKQIFGDLLKTPVVLIIFMALGLRIFGLEIPEPVLVPISYLADGFMPMALMTLGIQLANISWEFKINTVLFSNTIRLLVSPVIALLLVNFLDITGTVAQVLIISSALPTALNVALLAIEYDNDSDFASQVVLTSTVISVFTLTGLIALVKVLI